MENNNNRARCFNRATAGFHLPRRVQRLRAGRALGGPANGKPGLAAGLCSGHAGVDYLLGSTTWTIASTSFSVAWVMLWWVLT